MSGVGDLLSLALAQEGIGEPNKFQDWYNRNVDDLGNGNWAWCAAFVSWVFAHSGNGKLVKPRAYTVYMANDFEKAGRWYVGTTGNVNRAQPGDVVFFDWAGSDSRAAIDHVGIVVKALGGGQIQTIEGNTGNAVRLRIRDASDIAGYGRPAWPSAPAPTPAPKVVVPSGVPALFKGSKGNAVRQLQTALKAVFGAKLVVDGVYGPLTEKAVRAAQIVLRVPSDGIYGPKTAKALAAKVE